MATKETKKNTPLNRIRRHTSSQVRSHGSWTAPAAPGKRSSWSAQSRHRHFHSPSSGPAPATAPWIQIPSPSFASTPPNHHYQPLEADSMAPRRSPPPLPATRKAAFLWSNRRFASSDKRVEEGSSDLLQARCFCLFGHWQLFFFLVEAFSLSFFLTLKEGKQGEMGGRRWWKEKYNVINKI